MRPIDVRKLTKRETVDTDYRYTIDKDNNQVLTRQPDKSLTEDELKALPVRDALVTDKRLTLDSTNNFVMTNQPDNSAIGTAASKDTGTAADQIPLNSDLGTSATKDIGTLSTQVPTNGDLGTASVVNVGTAQDQIETNALKDFKSFDSLTSAIAYVTAYPDNIKRLDTASRRSSSECAALGINYPDGGGADYIVAASGTGTPDGGSFINAGSVQLQLNMAGDVIGEVFGALGTVLDDGTGYDSTDDLRNALLYCKSSGKNLVLGGRCYKSRDLVIPSGVYVIGSGVGKWDLPSHGYNYELDGGTTILIHGAPDNTVEVRGVTNASLGGGVIANPDSVTATDSEYTLLNLMNENATGSVAATPKALKVGILLEEESYDSSLRNIRVLLSNSGINGYNNDQSVSLGDDWDIGVLSLNSKFTSLENAQVVGYWRMAAMLQVNAANGLSPSSGAIFNDYRSCYFQGYKGMSIRANDVYRVTAITASTAEIPWTTSNPFSMSGAKFILGGQEVTYTSASVAGDKLTLAGASTDLTAIGSVGSELAYGTNIGVAACSVDGATVISDLQHTSRVAAHYLGFNNPSEALEISGFPIRDVEINAHMFSTDVVCHLHDCQHIDFITAFVEATGYRVALNGAFQAQGARAIASPDDSIGFGTYPAGETDGVVFPKTAEWNAFVDLGPMERSISSLRFTSPISTGLFRPKLVSLEAKGPYTPDFPLRSYSSNSTISTKNGGLRVVQDSPFKELANFDAASTTLILKPDTFGGLTIQQQTAGADARLRLFSPTNSVNWDVLVDDSAGQAFQIRRNGAAVLSISSAGDVTFTGTISSQSGARILSATGSPEGVVTGEVGDTYQRTDGGAGTSFYVKESGIGNTGWISK